MGLRSTANLARKIALRDGVSAEEAIDLAIDQVVERSELEQSAEQAVRKSVQNELLAFGQLQQYLEDPSIEEIWVNSPNCVLIARDGVSIQTNTVLAPNEIQVIVERMLRPTGRRLDRSSPFVDASWLTVPDFTW